jgi:hypothetical protein
MYNILFHAVMHLSAIEYSGLGVFYVISKWHKHVKPVGARMVMFVLEVLLEWYRQEVGTGTMINLLSGILVLWAVDFRPYCFVFIKRLVALAP